MKKLSYLALAAVGLLLGACSSDRDVADNGGTNLDGKGQGYLNVSVNLPTQPQVSTRAGWQEVDQLKDGEGYEYAVDNVLLAVFGGVDETSATLQQVVVKNGTWNDNKDNPNQITKTSTNIVFPLDQAVSGAKLFILAALNYSDVLQVNGNTITTKGTVQKNVKTIGDLQAAQIETNDASTPFRNTDNHFFMTNAVLSNKATGDSKLNDGNNAVVLAQVYKIYQTESEAAAAESQPSAEIFVERGLAKVTLTWSGLTVENSVKDAEGKDLTASLNGWVLDNTNKKSYIGRNIFTQTSWGLYSDYASSTSNDRFRFVGANPTKPEVKGTDNNGTNLDEYGNPLLYRSYWSPDPNYGKDATSDDLYEPVAKVYAENKEDIDGVNAAESAQYCFENTFDVEHQTYRNTTRAVVGIKFNGGNDFYTLNNDHKTLYKSADLQKEAAKALMLNTTFKKWYSDNGGGATLEGENVTVNWAKDKAGIVKVKNFVIKIGTEDKTYSTEDVIKQINTDLGIINRYKGGIAYYAVRIKHFGDDLTPWSGHGEKESAITDIYPDLSNARYLGRYGVLRNNWYELSLGAIKKLGHPIVPWLNSDPNDPDEPDDPDPNPEDPDHPDDSLDDTYLAAKIHILSWAKRPQGVTLQ